MHQYWLGKKRSEETKQKIRDSLKKIYQNPKDHPQYIGKIIRSGYYYIKRWDHPNCGKQGYVAFHRLVMEKYLGRFLKKFEVVHHIDGNTLNNSLTNLKLCSGHGKHIVDEHPSVMKKMWASNTGHKSNQKQLDALAMGRKYWARKSN